LRRSRRPLIIAARRSALSRAQAEAVGGMLSRINAGLAVEYHWLESEGDQQQHAPLHLSGGKALFTRRIEQALLDKQADLAIHSFKDVPADDITPGLTFVAVPRREDPRDCLITHHDVPGVAQLPRGATIGTSSPRRAAQIKRMRDDLHVKLIRGNVDTRMRKVLENKEFDATLLAVAGLNRLGLSVHANRPFSLEEMLPSAGQGALAIQCRSNDTPTLTRCLPINDAASSTAVHIERQIVAELGANCFSPIAVYVQATNEDLRVRARVVSLDGTKMIDVDDHARPSHVKRLVQRVVKAMTDQGAVALLRSAKSLY
jgi:hydroxymethylbilane synthase